MNKLYRITVILNLTGFLILMGCGGGSGGSGNVSVDNNGGGPPPIIFMVTQISPDNGSVSVASIGEIRIAFNNTVDNANISSSNINVSKSGGVSIKGNIICDGKILKFVPLTPLTAGDYKVTISSEIKDNNGNRMRSPYVFNFFVKNGSWKSPVPIAFNNISAVRPPLISIGKNGYGIAIYEKVINWVNYVYYSRYNKESGWDNGHILNTNINKSAFVSSLVSDSDNCVFALWTDDRIMGGRYTEDFGWTEVQPIDNGSTSPAANSEPKVSILPSGGAMAVWSHGTTWFNRYVRGVGWGSAQSIESADSKASNHPLFFTNTNGDAIAVWQRYDGTSYEISANTFDLGTGWNISRTLNSGPIMAYSFGCAIDPYGNSAAIWQESNGIWVSNFNKATGWGGAINIQPDISPYVKAPKISFDQDGNGFAVWTKLGATWAARYLIDQGWDVPQIVVPPQASSVNSMIQYDRYGNAIVMYQVGGSNYIYSIRYTRGAGWGISELIGQNTGYSYPPYYSINDNGIIWMIWCNQITGYDPIIVYVNRYD